MQQDDRKLTHEQHDEILSQLKTRFEKNTIRHVGLNWEPIQTKLEASPERLWSLYQMEQTGGEPDVVSREESTGNYVFYDCSTESPKDRRSLCYDRAALESRKENRPDNSVLDLAADLGIELLTQDQYRALQMLGIFDAKTSSWVKTPDSIRRLGGALFCDRRYNTVFVYHNGAESYYSSRGFRASLRV
jgi:hypothetical protein